jgi:hypothetical protein
VTSVSGANAVITVVDIQGVSANVSVDVANNDIGIGSIREIDITNFGIAYSNAAIDATSVGDGNAVLAPVISGLATSTGRFLTDDGKVGVRIIQDSLFYQDFSYVIRSGLPFSEYRSLVKDTLHPAGTEFFGEILISSYILLAPIIYSTIDTEKNGEYVATIKSVLSFFDAGIVTPPTAPEIHIDIVPAPIDVTGNEHREINVEIALPKTLAIPVPTMERNIKFELYTDVGVDDPYVQVRELRKQPTFAKIMTLASPAGVEYTIDVQSNAIATVSESAEYSLKVESSFESLAIPLPVSLKKNIINETKVAIAISNPLAKNDLLFADVKISSLADTEISQYADKTFNDLWTTKVVIKQVRITGTLDMIGTSVQGYSTDFTNEFAAGDYFIVGDEKFIVSSVANSTHMEVNVSPTGSYANQPAYREISL